MISNEEWGGVGIKLPIQSSLDELNNVGRQSRQVSQRLMLDLTVLAKASPQ
jgi:hypothetical protein